MQVKGFLLANSALLWKLFLQGFILTVILVCVQIGLEASRVGFMNYMSPLGFFFLMLTTYLIQPILVGVLNIFLINVFYKTKGWQVNWWLNGVMLLFAFSAFNVVIQTSLNNIPFLPAIALIDIVVLSFPFGCLARFSNGGWKKPID
jgi:hypothetical protein